MKNPINNRIPRLFIKQPGRTLPIFILLLITIIVISAFFIVQGSVERIYYDFLEEGKVEDGQLTLLSELSADAKERVERAGFKIYENFFVNTKLGSSNLEIHKIRKDINIATLIDGRIPDENDEIALDHNYALNNGYELGEVIKFKNGSFRLVGYVVMPDYIAMIKKRNDLIMDTINFGAGLVTEEGFESISENAVQYCYSYHENKKSTDKKEALDKLKDISEAILQDNIIIDASIKADNKRISYLIDDMGGDVPMITTLLVIIMISIAFVFTVQSKNLIEEEAGVIGTLMASGYKKSELVLHYMLFPLLSVSLAAIIGNMLTYAKYYDIFTGLYYSSFSLPPFIPYFHARAFLLTSIIPSAIIIFINLFMLINKLSISPLKFLRNELSKKRNKSRLRLPNMSFLRRFKLKVLFDNKLNVFVLIIGITLANILLCFGLGFKPIFNHHVENVKNEQVSQYQTFVRGVDNLDEEKFAASSFDLIFEKQSHSFILNGISENSKYYDNKKLDNLKEKEIMASDGLMKKFGIKIGDELELKNPYTNEIIKVLIKESREDAVSLSAYMPIKNFNELMGYDENYFSGYYSDKKLDIDDKFIITQIDTEATDKAMSHFVKTFGAIRRPIIAVSLIFYFVFMYLLSKMIIDKSKTQISYLKIFGFNDRENSGIYLNAAALIVVIYLLISPYILQTLMYMLMTNSLKKFDAYMSPYIPTYVYILVIATGLTLFFLVQRIQTRKISKINMVEALKDVNG